MTATPRQPITPATAAEWRRRREASVDPPVAEESQKPRNGFRVPAYTATVQAQDAGSGAFAESQQAGIAMMLGLTSGIAPPRPRPPAEEPVVTAPTPQEPVTVPPPVAPGQFGSPECPARVTPGRVAARRAQASRKRKAAWRGYALAQAQTLPLAVTLVIQAALSLRLVWRNTAFPDEGLYLWSGRLEWAHWLHGTPIPNFPTYFSGAPVVYPPLGAMAAALGGLIGGRILSLCFMLSTTVLLHGVTRRLLDQRSANLAAALFAGLGATQFLGAFATYDAMALLLLALATWLSIRASECRLAVQIPLLLAAAGALALADAAKYAATLFDPVVIVVAGLAAWRAGSRRDGIVAVVTISSALCLLLFLGVKLGGHVYWRGINYTTLSRAHGTSSAAGIAADSFGWAALIAILALIGAAAAIAKQPQLPAKLCMCVLAGAVLLAPANQARIHVFTSLFKHVGFGAWFAAVVAGYALASLADAVPEVKKGGAALAGAGVVAVGLLLGASLAQTHFESWPNTTSFIAHLRTLLPAHKGRVLAADNGNVIEFYLPGELQGMIFSGPWFIRYQDPSTGRYLVGRAAFADAIKHRYFSVIALSFGDSRATDEAIGKDISTYGGYQLIATVPYRAAGLSSAFRIWAREGTG